MDEIKDRLQKTSEQCFKAYESWRKDEKNAKAREAVQEAVHELRKVASRVEIELAVSERTEITQKPIPIPPHRDGGRRPSRGRGGKNDKGNNDKGHSDKGGNDSQKSRGKRQGGTRRKASGGEHDKKSSG